MRLWGHAKDHGQGLTARADAVHDELFAYCVIEAYGAEVEREIVFQGADDHLKNAAQILPFPYRARNLVEQIQSVQLSLQSSLRLLVVLDIGVRAEPLDDGARRVPQGNRPRFEPAVDTVGASNPKLDIEMMLVNG